MRLVSGVTMEIDPSTADGMYRTMTSLIVPRPIGWISTSSEDGDYNVAPYSFFGGLNEENPPVIMFSAEDTDDGGVKDSVANVQATGEFVHNVVTMDLIEEMDRTAEPIESTEFDAAGLTPESSTIVGAPRVAEAKAHIECSLYDLLRIGDHIVVLGEVKRIHVDDDLLTESGKVDVRKVDPVARLTGTYYGKVEAVEVDRNWD